MQESIEIRPAAPEDIKGVHAIYAREVAEGTASFELVAPDVEEIRRRFQSLKTGGYPYLVAAGEDDAVVGYAYAGPYRTRPGYRFSVENSVYVADGARRHGIATRLLDALITECELLGFRQMVAIIGDSAHLASIELHRKAGFRLVGNIENVGYKFERWLDSVIMQRALGPGATTAPDPRT
jgi:phosphinothricin acetyltransferase